jgi:hypothetical protein
VAERRAEAASSKQQAAGQGREFEHYGLNLNFVSNAATLPTITFLLSVTLPPSPLFSPSQTPCAFRGFDRTSKSGFLLCDVSSPKKLIKANNRLLNTRKTAPKPPPRFYSRRHSSFYINININVDEVSIALLSSEGLGVHSHSQTWRAHFRTPSTRTLPCTHALSHSLYRRAQIIVLQSISINVSTGARSPYPTKQM